MVLKTMMKNWNLWIWGPVAMLDRDDNGARWVRRMEFSSRPAWFCFTSSLLHMMGKIFLSHPRPLRPRKTLPHLVKIYFFLICPQLLQLFLIKPVLLIKIYLKLQINLPHQIKLIFSKNWVILLKCLTRQYHKKNKNLIVQNQ